MFNFSEYNHFLRHIKDMDRSKAERVLDGYLSNKDFAGALFNPQDSSNISEQASEMYKLTAKPKAIRLFIDTVSENGHAAYDRWVGVYLYSIASFNLDAANEAIDATKEDYDNGEITKSEARNQNERNDAYISALGKLNKLADKIVKREAKILAKKTGMPKDLCKYALKTTPNPWLIPRFRIGYYLNQLLGEIYTELDKDDVELADIEWRDFFKGVFGKENVLECATFILLEGTQRMKGFKGAQIRRIWDSLTSFALEELDHADPGSRSQMIELYIKRLTKMFKNGSFDLRVDLTTISEQEFPNLTKTVEKYASQIKDAFSTKPTENA